MRTIFDTAYGLASGIESGSKYTLAYLLKNRRLIALSEQGVRTIEKMRGFQSTPMVSQFGKIADQTSLEPFLFIDVARADDDVPTLLTVDEFSVDGSWVKDTPTDFAKLWVNMSPVLGKKAARDGQLILSDIPRAMGYIVRGYYVRKYHEREMFMSPALAKFVIESYSKSAQLRIARMYNLDADDSVMVQTAFAYHYAKLLGPKKDQNTAEPATLLHRCGFLGSYADINDRLSRLNDAAGGDFYKNGLVSLCETLAEAGPSRMSGKFDAHTFYRLFSIGTVDNKSMAISIDYPPYWVFMLLSYASGSKNGLMNNLFNLNSMKRQLGPFVDQLDKNRAFLEE
jgi:hypothetical protein